MRSNIIILNSKPCRTREGKRERERAESPSMCTRREHCIRAMRGGEGEKIGESRSGGKKAAAGSLLYAAQVGFRNLWRQPLGSRETLVLAPRPPRTTKRGAPAIQTRACPARSTLPKTTAAIAAPSNSRSTRCRRG